MAERMPLAYPNFEASQINFSLPLRLAHKRSMSSISTPSTSNFLEVPCLMRSRAASAPVSPAYAHDSTHTHPSGSDSTRSPTFPYQHNLSSPRARTISQPSISRRAPPRLQLHDRSRLRTNSTSTSTSSLEASLAELEELIEVLSTPLPLGEGVFSAQSEMQAGAKAEFSETIRAPLNSTTHFAHDEPGPRWI